MTARTAVHQSLPYIDKEPTPAERAAAESLISTELSNAPTPSPSLLPPPPAPTFTPLLATELSRLTADPTSKMSGGIDLDRYELQDEENSADDNQETLQTRLARAYTQNAYLTARHAHLELLDTYGKNAWLVGNWQTEAELAALERELAEAKKEIELVNHSRRTQQNEAGGELKSLEETWKKGVGRVLETEIAVEGLNKMILERRRGGG